MAFRDTIIERYLERALEEFDTNPVAKTFLRRLSYEAPAQFLQLALRHLRASGESNAFRFMAALALRQPEVVQYLANPAMMTTELAQRLFRRFLAVDASFDVKMARLLPDRGHINHGVALEGPRAIRAIDILDEQSHGRRLLPILGHLPDVPDTRVAARATLFVGRRVQSPDWAARQLIRSDQRIRANAVESIWGLKVPKAIALLENCADDRNNRVQGNALVGLHIAGHGSVEDELKSLAKTPSPEKRSTAAWAMGKIVDTRWSEDLSRLVKDEHPMVRSMPLRSLMTLRKTRPREAPQPTAEIQAPAEVPVLSEVTVQEEAALNAHPTILLPELRLDGSSFRSSV